MRVLNNLEIKEINGGVKFFNVIAGAVWGTVSGFILGGPAGAVAGAFYGASMGVAKEGADGLGEIVNPALFAK